MSFKIRFSFTEVARVPISKVAGIRVSCEVSSTDAMLWFLNFQRQTHATIPARNTIPRIPPTRTGVEKKEELDATAVAAAVAPVPVFEAETSGEVVNVLRAGLAASIAVADIRAGVAASSTVAVGNPALESSLLMLSAVSLPASS